jgi:hypothetical protein
MKFTYRPTKAKVQEDRKKAYLKNCPIEMQLEALTEAAQGRPEKLNTLIERLAEIKSQLPYSNEPEV